MAGGEFDRLDPAGKDTAFTREDDLGRTTAVDRLGGKGVVVYRVENKVVATDWL